MKHSKRKVTVFALISILIYLAPNFVQDYHRIWGHKNNFCEILNVSGTQIHEQHNKCAACKFEFSIIEDIAIFVYSPSLYPKYCLFAEKGKNQIQKTAFYYYNLRAPPTA